MTAPHLSFVTTDQSWNDLDVTEKAIKHVEQIKAWLKASDNPKKIEARVPQFVLWSSRHLKNIDCCINW